MLVVSSLEKTYPGKGGGFTAVADMSFTVREGELFSIVGPSGAGKTTLLRCVAGLDKPTSGSVTFNGQRVDGPPANFAVVFQDYARSLFPWITVAKNVELPLIKKGISTIERRTRVERALAEVGLADAAHKKPFQLSGGMQQRVAIARAIAYRPAVLIMDEPFASVDAQTRADLEDLLLRVRDETGTTVLFVTHDVDESVYLSNRVAIVTRSPSCVAEVVDIDLPEQRDQIETKSLPEFAHLRAHVFSRIREMVRNDAALATT
ncbi:ABC transporter ATP-binding protein [Mycolicibacterium vaccae]|jgi:NitT/TauT family transport system ATP-binding protein|uniref:ABC transporter-like protein n=1 Tax=Mycolicibacterium vaccae ATCC 25954 TaxID=1194972 RepID=K0UWH2_MYCVA|nr:ABC transporter ATP-binding protein [Mycolicibacterium vaccae]ANI37339.1 ABC transporter [Mycolicibacterium vaccae 95051]EJZ11447.1 ABC transporter-like protein [Mycolicibacterium vaccae ATCC 25954]